MSEIRVGSLFGFQTLKLAATFYGDESAAPIILAHGGGQTRRAWADTASALSDAGHYAIAVDLRGHGESAWCPKGDYRIEAFAHDLEAICRYFESPPVLIGASLGGIAAMIAAGEMNPSIFRALILVDITPTMESSGVEKIIQFMSAHVEEGFGSVKEAAEAISAYLPHRPKPENLNGLESNLRKIDDRYYWHWDPKFVLGENRPTGSRDPSRLAKAVQNTDAPIMLVRGRMSELVSEENVAEFLALVPSAHFVDIAGAHHMVVGDKNDAFTIAISEFIESISNQSFRK